MHSAYANEDKNFQTFGDQDFMKALTCFGD